MKHDFSFINNNYIVLKDLTNISIEFYFIIIVDFFFGAYMSDFSYLFLFFNLLLDMSSKYLVLIIPIKYKLIYYFSFI